MNRQFLARALRLGFEQLLVFGPQTPLQCSDDRRTYVWMVLDDRQLPGSAAEPVRIESPVVSTGAETPAALPTRRRAGRRKALQAAAADSPRKVRLQTLAAVTEAPDNPIEAAQALRTSLRETLASARQLVRSLKRRQRQERIVATTLASLKQLQRLAS